MATNDIGPRIGIDGEKQFRDSLSAINAQLKALGAEMKAVTAEAAANANSEEALAQKNEVLGRSAEAVKNKMTVLDSQLTRQKEKLAALKAELDRVIAAEGENSAAAARAQNAYNRQVREVANLESQYQTARRQLADFQNQMDSLEESADQTTESLSAQDVLAGIGAWSALEGAVRSVSAAMQDAIRTSMEFDASMSDVAATMGTTTDQIGEMRDFALEMGANTAFTATQAAQALNYMALAGYDAQTAMSTLPTVLDLAAAGGVELASASDMITDAQSALGLSLEETTRLVDEMAQTSTKSNTSVAQLGEAILTVGGTAKFMAGGTAEINQVLGILADNSVKGAEGGTKLRNIILSLSSPTEKAAKTLDQLKVSIFDAEGNMRQFSEIFPEMQQALSKLTSEEQIQALGEIFNSRDIAAAQALLGTATERWEELALAIDGAEGAASRMAETRLDNLAGDLTLLQSAADGVKIAFSDSMTPALREVAQASTELLSGISGMLTEFPLLGNILAGAVVGVGALTVGMGAMSAASALGATSIGALTSAIMASPVAPFALAIGAATAAFTALSYAAEHSEEKITAAGRAVAESKAAFEEQQAAAQAQRDDVEALAAQLEELAGKENRTAGEKEQLLAITEKLNQAVPDLGLSYDSLTDSLSMTTDQVLELARAQASAQEQADLAAAIVQAEQVRRQAADELAAAEERLAKATERRDNAMKNGSASVAMTREELQGLRDSADYAQKEVDELTLSIQESDTQIAEMKEQLEELAGSGKDAADGLDEAGNSMDGAGARAEEAAASLEGLEAATLYAAGAADTLSDALKEQEKEGSLSVETAKKLTDAGYGAAIAIDQETGAVTVNREEYIRLANAKIQEQMATLEAEKAAVQARQKLLEESLAAQDATRGYYDLAQAKTLAAYADDTKALDLQIAALKRAQASMTSYSGTVTSTARKSSSASKSIKTQAQKDLEEYKTLKSELDHEQAMGLIQDQAYYQRLGELRDQYLTDAANIDDYRKVSETIYKADQKALEEREKLWETAGKSILKLEEDFQKELSSRAEEIVNSYKLFDEVPEYQKAAGEDLITNLEDQINSIQTFYSNIAALEERGVGAGLVNEIRSMGVKASGELQGLLDLTDEDLSKYAELYEEKQQLANQIAIDELKALREETNDEILGQLDDVAALYDLNGPALGLTFTQKLADGMFQGMGDVERMAQNVATAAMDAFNRTYNRDVEAMMTSSKSRVSTEDIGTMLAGAVNGLNTMSAGMGSGDLTIQIPINGRTIAETTISDFRQVGRERPETADD